ncbi:zinc metalloproteinase nas-12-like isoform X1 [Homalodisca vitripennis]|uniref:zinc metalloproteinase nas-12-like isoform X1 n=2 Tax=Homalodisca vitripennis TaxID=197043 RepID=UPI001EEC44FC|nr:zinc metalloproteinase nas-12-like isoform X1 [Homalodisca vitripennis]
MVKSFAIAFLEKFFFSVFKLAIFAIPVFPQQQNYSNYSFGWADDVFYGRLKNESWTHGVIYYDLDPFLTPEMVHAINHVIHYFNSLDVCMQWLQRIPFSFDDNVKDYISFVHHRDSPNKVFCSSKINRVGGQQQIKLGTFCVQEKLKVPLRLENTVLHEMVHAMGLHHEHQRPDRDCYIYIPPQLAARPRYTRVKGSYFPSGFP